MLIGDHNELQELVPGGDLDRLALQFVCFLAPAPGFDELMVAEDFGHTSADRLRGTK